MKKIIIAFDGVHYSEGAVEFARRLNELHPILLTGVFLPQTELANLWSYGDGIGTPFIPVIESDQSAVVFENIKRFEKVCQGNNIDYRLHKDFYEFALPELKTESRFADLLILGSEVFYGAMGIDSPYNYVQDALHDLSCPVLLVPEHFEFPESIILSYDGSDDSVFAIKQFAYLFPELCDRKTLLVYADEDADKDFPDKIQIEELAARHFSDLSFFKLDINPKKYFQVWILEKTSALLVSGAYGRSGFSQLLKRSFVKDIIADHRLPIFIAHR